MIETILVATVVLGVLIFIHELGHYLVAKKAGVSVEKFSLGFGPKIIGKTVGETEYLISAFPLGGYVKLYGEDPDEEVADPERSFTHASVWKRLAIVAAGPIFNMLFAVIIFSIVFMAGVPTLSAVVGEVQEGSPAFSAGLLPADTILSIDEREVRRWEDLVGIIHESPDKPLRFRIQRSAGAVFEVNITPEAKTTKNIFGEEIRVGLVGIQASQEYFTERFNPIVAVWKGMEKTWKITYLTLVSIKKIVEKTVPSDSIGGPILIFQMAGEQARIGIMNLVFFVALLSVNLGILNLFPIPILDGGHILFYLFEIVFRKPLSVKIREASQKVGLAMLITLMVFAFYNDIMRIFSK